VAEETPRPPPRRRTAYGAIVDDVWPRADGYCLLVERDLYLRHPLDERFEWWWCTSRLQAELLAAGHRVRALRDHSGIIRHAFGGSGRSYAGARGMETDRATVRGWFGGRPVELL
jgi:hypothetical protein